MRLFKQTYKDTTGQRVRAESWSVDFSDHVGIRRRIPLGVKAQKPATGIARQIEDLVSCRAGRQIPSRDLQEWLEQIPSGLRNRLAKIGLVTMERAASGKPLSAHMEDFEASLVAKGDTPRHAKKERMRAEAVLGGCGARYWSDIDALRVERHLSTLDISDRTRSYYLKAAKHFCRWMLSNQRAQVNPLQHLRPRRIDPDAAMKRRALEVGEIGRLLDATARCDKGGPERALLYRLALESGLRASELRSLRVSSFDFKQYLVTVGSIHTKNRQEAQLPLKEATAAMLQQYFQGKLPEARAFHVPTKTADMLRRDLTAAGIDWQDTGAGVLDFHSLRHTFCTLLVNSGVSVKAAQVLMRHSTAELTLNRYSHLYRGQDAEALAQLPDFAQVGQATGQRTGTDDGLVDDEAEPEQKIPAKTPAKMGTFEGISAESSGQKTGDNVPCPQNTKPAPKCNQTHSKAVSDMTSRDGTRTHTPLRAGDFKSPASANSATRPPVLDLPC